jgi:hypothetical protein
MARARLALQVPQEGAPAAPIARFAETEMPGVIRGARWRLGTATVWAVATNIGSAVEQDLIRAVAEGRVLTCSNLDPLNLMQSADKRHVIRAQMIREILLGRHVEQPDPHGLRLVGARINGTLDATPRARLLCGLRWIWRASPRLGCAASGGRGRCGPCRGARRRLTVRGGVAGVRS